MRSEFAAIAAAFGLLPPTLTANAVVAVNAGGTGLVATSTPALGTPASGTLPNCTGLPISTGIAGLGTGVATALGINVGSAGAPVVFNGALGAPSSGTLTNCTGLPNAGLVNAAITIGSTNVALGGTAATVAGLTLTAPALGTPASGVLTNCTGLPISTGVSGLGAGVATFLATPTSANLASALTDALGSGKALFGSDGTFAPTDQSGAGLSLTVSRAAYTKVGTRYLVDVTLTFPSTASSALAVLGFGALPNCANVSGVGGLVPIYYGGTAFLAGFLVPGTNTMQIATASGVQVTNSSLSTFTLRFQFSYPTV